MLNIFISFFSSFFSSFFFSSDFPNKEIVLFEVVFSSLIEKSEFVLLFGLLLFKPKFDILFFFPFSFWLFVEFIFWNKLLLKVLWFWVWLWVWVWVWVWVWLCVWFWAWFWFWLGFLFSVWSWTLFDDENNEVLLVSGLFWKSDCLLLFVTVPNKFDVIVLLLLVCWVWLLNKLFDGFVLLFEVVLLLLELIPNILVLFACFNKLLFFDCVNLLIYFF